MSAVSLEMSDEPNEYAVRLTFPRFKAENTFNLKETLNAMGITKMFSMANAFDFCLFNMYCFVDNVIQKTSLEVDEKGTEAAAASDIDIAVVSTGEKQPEVDIVLNRPFYYVIREVSTNTPLFIGYQGSIE